MKTDKEIEAMAEQWKLEHGMQIQLPPLAYYSQVQAFKSGYKQAQRNAESEIKRLKDENEGFLLLSRVEKKEIQSLKAQLSEKDAEIERVNRNARLSTDYSFWFDGYPTDFRQDEWFIAKTRSGKKVVLRSLPKPQFAYDFTTADETHWKKEEIVRWAQFPDSNYISKGQEEIASLKSREQKLVDLVKRMLREREYVCGFDKPCVCPACNARETLKELGEL